jgi:hypothetical protein
MVVEEGGVGVDFQGLTTNKIVITPRPVFSAY